MTNDERLAKLLTERGLLSPEELAEAEAARGASGRPLADVLVERKLLSATQVRDAQEALERRVRFCSRCQGPVYVARMRPEGECCPRCLQPVEWQPEAAVARIRDVENIVRLTKDDLPAEVASARLQPDRIFGKYILLDEIGRGGAGVVRKAWDTMLGEHVALKFIRPQKDVPSGRQVHQEQILDLLQEARAALRLRHEHIVAIRDIGRIDDRYFIAMEFVDGETLADHIHSAKERQRLSPLYEEPAYFLGILRDVANAIHYAHTFPKPIVHLDIKPANVLLSREGKAFVMDFGLARALGERVEDEKLRGTPAYMAPEQVSTRDRNIGPWTDVYAMGATLYELLTGRPPFTGEPLDVLLKASREAPERPSEVIRKSTESGRHDSTKFLLRLTKLDEICLRCLEKDPARRYPTARAVAEELETVIEALRAGRETGIVPERIRRAQERSELRKVDDHMTHLRLEEALRESERLSKKRDETRVKRDLELRRRQVELLEGLRTRLVAKLNAMRPSYARFSLVRETLQDVEVMKATPKKLFLLRGDAVREVEWSQLPPVMVVAMAEGARMAEPEDRMALGILCHYGGLVEQAMGYLSSLFGTPFEELARAVLESSA